MKFKRNDRFPFEARCGEDVMGVCSAFLGSSCFKLPNRAFENHCSQLTRVVDRICAHMHVFSIVFSMDQFLPFIDILQQESVE